MMFFSYIALIAFSFFSLLLLPPSVRAAEEELNLETETAPKLAAINTAPPFHLMGRVDLTYELGNPNPTSEPEGGDKSQFKNYHFFVFLKAKTSPKTSFMGEIVGQKFYYIEHEAAWAELQFGKILVPFGNNRHFHHFYGGIHGYASKGVMVPNIWAEPGLNFKWKVPGGHLDSFLVNSISATDSSSDPDLQRSSSHRQAQGLRYTFSPTGGLTGIVSAYSGSYWDHRRLFLSGVDFYTDYGALDSLFFRSLRWAFGFAYADIHDAPVSGDFNKRGDYLEIATNAVAGGELRIRYGTYIHNSKQESKNDVHNFNFGYRFKVDAINILIEKQWNYEAINEVNNDLFRVMAALDF